MYICTLTCWTSDSKQAHEDHADSLWKHTCTPCSLAQAMRSSCLVAVASHVDVHTHAYTDKQLYFSNKSIICESREFNQMHRRFPFLPFLHTLSLCGSGDVYLTCINQVVVPQTDKVQQFLNYPNSSKATFYYEYHYNSQDGGSLVALWQL